MEIRNYGQGWQEETLTYPHPNVRLAHTKTSATSAVTTRAHYFFTDQLGSLRTINDNSAAFAQRSVYRPFG